MKRTICVLLLLLLLCSCDGVDGGHSSAPNSSAAQSSVAGSLSDVSSEEDELCKEARRLLQLDIQVAGIFAGQSLVKYATIPSYAVAGDYFTLSDDCPYKSLSDIEALMDSVYSFQGDMTEYFLNYPPVGKPAVREAIGGGIDINIDYKSDFDLNLDAASISLISQENNNYNFQYSQGSNIFTFVMQETKKGFRLAESLLYIYEQQLMDSQPKRILETQNTGNAKTLRGTCYMIHFFVDTPDAKWSLDEAKAIVDDMPNAWQYIQRQAAAYGVEDIVFKDSYYYIESPSNITDSTYSDSWVADTLDAIGLDAFSDVTAYANIPQYSNYTVLFHINTTGRSFALMDNGHGFYDEYSVIFQKDSKYIGGASTCVHEVLHNFGAIDLYDEALSEKGDQLAAIYFPNDIMRVSYANTYRACVGLLTAKLVGWCDSVPPQITAFLNIR